MKIFYLTPKQLFEAVVIAVVLSFAYVALTVPAPVSTPPVVITPVPTPEPVYIQPQQTQMQVINMSETMSETLEEMWKMVFGDWWYLFVTIMVAITLLQLLRFIRYWR